MNQTFSREDYQWMSHALWLSQMAEGFTAPNPCVGAVLVHQGQLIGAGWHQYFGGPHAEVNCIRSVRPEHQALIPQSTMYVTLEPCAHYGKTPPCAKLLVEQGIKEVVIACADPFAKVNGAGIRMLQEAGVNVRIGLLEPESRQSHKQFFTFHGKARPYITLKWAQTANGYIGTGTDKRLLITHSTTNRWVHLLRSKSQAILIGIETLLKDNPLLDTRLYPGKKNPIPIVIDPNGRADYSLKLFQSGRKVFVVNTIDTVPLDIPSGVQPEFIKLPPGFDLAELMQALYERQIMSVLVEGGRTTLQRFIDEGFWDEVFVITHTQMHLDKGIKAPDLKNARYFENFAFDSEQITHWIEEHNEFYL